MTNVASVLGFIVSGSLEESNADVSLAVKTSHSFRRHSAGRPLEDMESNSNDGYRRPCPRL